MARHLHLADDRPVRVCDEVVGDEGGGGEREGEMRAYARAAVAAADLAWVSRVVVVVVVVVVAVGGDRWEATSARP